MPANSSWLDGSLAARVMVDRLENTYGIVPLKGVAPGAEERNVVVVQLNNQSALVFQPATSISVSRLILVPSTFGVSIITVFLILLSAYAVRWITLPLSSIAAAALSFGRSSPDEPMLEEQGPREISQVARALNEMRTRIRALVDDRTRM